MPAERRDFSSGHGDGRPTRPETREALYPTADLAAMYPGVVGDMRAGLSSAASVDQLVGVIRSANLRAQVARSRGALRDFEYEFYDVKYRGLIKAVVLRYAYPGQILIGHSEKTDRNGAVYEVLTFEFAVEPRPYRTDTSLNNLTQRVGDPEAFRASLEPYDDLPPSEPRHRFSDRLGYRY